MHQATISYPGGQTHPKHGSNVMSTTVLRSFRLVCPQDSISHVESLLHAQGYRFEPEPFSPWVRRLVEEPRPLGGSLAAFFGYLYIQDRSSMLPPLALAPQPGDAVIDMCASPGSKTGFLAQLVGPTGFVMGNEPNRTRLATLRQNLQTLNLLHAATCSYPGEALPLPDGGWDRIQLDPPCSGWGTVERNPQVLTLWQGDKIRPLIGLQRLLLAEATRLLRPGGSVVYSTCTTNVDENEAQVRYAVETLGLEVEPLAPPPGFVFADPELPGCDGTLRVDPEASSAQGFYIARLRKPGPADVAERSPLPEVEPLAFRPLRHKELAAPGVDPALLPEGAAAVFGDTPYFLPRQALERLPASFRWMGCPLGKAPRGDIRLSPRLHALMPHGTTPAIADEERLVLEDPADIEALLQGRSRTVASRGREISLYWHDLPLCRLKLKNGRALWSER